MIVKLIGNEIKQNKLYSLMTVFFMAASAMLTALTVLLFANLAGAVGSLMDKAQVPDYMQMHAGELDEEVIARFADNHEEIEKWQICPFLNLDNSRITLGGHTLADSTQDNGLAVQGEQFDYLLDMENKLPQVRPGEVYVPVCYRARYGLSVGDSMVVEIGAGPGDSMEFKEKRREFVIAGFLRDAQMNSMMASSKRFLVNAADYESIKQQDCGIRGNSQEEYLIEFLLEEGTDTNVFGRAAAEAELPANGPAITKPLIRMMNVLSDGTMIFVIFLVSIMILLISLLCIRFMLLLQMEQDKREVGMLKALGVGKIQILRIYFAKYLLFALSGAGIGILAPFVVKRPMERQIQELYGVPDRGFLAGVLALMGVLFTEGILLIFVRVLLKKMDKMPVLKALSGTQEAKTGRGQYVMIGFVAAACVFLVLVPQNLSSTMSAPEFVTYMGIGDGEIRMDVRQTGDIDRTTAQIADALEKDEQVEKYTVLRTKTCTAVSPDQKTVNLTVETGSHWIFPVSYLEGGPPEGEKEIAISSMNAVELGISVGEDLRLFTGGKETDYRVCGIYSDITNGGKTAKAFHIDGEEPVLWSVLYVSLKGSGQMEAARKEQWMAGYRQMGADVIAIGDYVKDTYSQTLAQLRLASVAALGIAVSVTALVVVLFMRLIVEQNRDSISLHKALGFTSKNMKRIYFIKGMCPAIVGIAAGLFMGNFWGEGLCAMVLKSFGVDGFRFVTDGKKAAAAFFLLMITAAAAVWTGIREIKRVRACECCMGRD